MSGQGKRKGWRAGLKRVTTRLGRRKPSIPSGPFTLTVDGMATIEVKGGSTILAAAIGSGVEISHYCGGMASCGTCKVSVVSGGENLLAATGREQMVLGSQSTAGGERLACQAQVVGPVTVRIPRWF